MTAFRAAHVHRVLLGGWIQDTGTMIRVPALLTMSGVALLVTIGLTDMSG